MPLLRLALVVLFIVLASYLSLRYLMPTLPVLSVDQKCKIEFEKKQETEEGIYGTLVLQCTPQESEDTQQKLKNTIETATARIDALSISFLNAYLQFDFELMNESRMHISTTEPALDKWIGLEAVCHTNSSDKRVPNGQAMIRYKSIPLKEMQDALGTDLQELAKCTYNPLLEGPLKIAPNATFSLRNMQIVNQPHISPSRSSYILVGSFFVYLFAFTVIPLLRKIKSFLLKGIEV